MSAMPELTSLSTVVVTPLCVNTRAQSVRWSNRKLANHERG